MIGVVEKITPRSGVATFVFSPQCTPANAKPGIKNFVWVVILFNYLNCLRISKNTLALPAPVHQRIAGVVRQ